MSSPGERFIEVGLGFDATTGVYKLVRLFSKEGNSVICGCKVLSMEPRQEWRFIRDAPCKVLWLPPVFVKGNIHWLVLGSLPTTGHSQVPYVLSFDLKDDKSRLMPTPEPVRDLFFVALLESQGHLCFVQHPTPPPRPNNFIQVWFSFASYLLSRTVVCLLPAPKSSDSGSGYRPAVTLPIPPSADHVLDYGLQFYQIRVLGFCVREAHISLYVVIEKVDRASCMVTGTVIHLCLSFCYFGIPSIGRALRNP
ncbi:uncharacterized protein A4U43_C02F880 [Asparagus officinalis]|uniref:F-box associated beta-propeller type 3 domain-containing protein n=1 Tax=Asparagus officinalis TaxID=4686 RepID=A0A5P1FHI9_ASPOF|nr:uncharacterized protein A4U43_C02F880 [Asparagus officinalis]